MRRRRPAPDDRPGRPVGVKHTALRVAMGIVAVVLMIAVTGLLLVDFVFLPRAIDTVAARIAKETGYELNVEGCRYRPFGTFVFREVSIADDTRVESAAAAPPGLRTTARRVRITASFLTIRAIAGGPDIPVGTPRPEHALSTMWSFLESAVETRLLPRSVRGEGVRIRTGAAWGRQELAFDRIELGHRSAVDAVTIAAVPARDEAAGPRVTADMSFRIGKHEADGSIALEGIDLSRLPISRSIGSGAADLEAEVSTESVDSIDFRISLGLEHLMLMLPSVAPTPIREVGADWSCSGTYTPDAVVDPDPPAEFLENPTLVYPPPVLRHASDRSVDPPTEVPRGRIEIHESHLRLNGIGLRVRGTVEGLFDDGVGASPSEDDGQSREASSASGSDVDRGSARPYRFELSAELPVTPAQAVVAAIPPAVSGPLASIVVDGTVAWRFLLRVPCDALSRANWSMRTELDGFAVRRIPAAMNVYKLNDAFTHTLGGSQGSDSRTVTIPGFVPASTPWMLEHSEHTLAWIEETRAEHRRIVSSRPPAETIDETGGSGPSSDAEGGPGEGPGDDRGGVAGAAPAGDASTKPDDNAGRDRRATSSDGTRRDAATDRGDGTREDATTDTSDRPGEEAPSVRGSRGPKAGTGDYRYVRLEEMSPWVPRAVLTAEDGDFFFYEGINPVTLTDAIIRNIREDEIVLGASTISMQLVKMLFLNHERIFSRKIQEAFLVYLMEHRVPVSKDRILELYLNVVELGPGVYGIDHAARYYFSRDPADLTAGEATWLASILPAPKRYHRYFERGRISDGWFARMVGLYEIMLERGRMTAEEYAEAIRRPPQFR